MSRSFMRMKYLAGAVALVVGSITVSSAFAAGPVGAGLADEAIRKDFQTAVQKTAGAAAAVNPAVSLPDTADQKASLTTQAGRIHLGIPALVEAPWARDKSGRSVPTYFEISGTTLTQVVKHRGADFDYGIVADPSLSTAWRIIKCGSTIQKNCLG